MPGNAGLVSRAISPINHACFFRDTFLHCLCSASPAPMLWRFKVAFILITPQMSWARPQYFSSEMRRSPKCLNSVFGQFSAHLSLLLTLLAQPKKNLYF